jgi:hypothetical protein
MRLSYPNQLYFIILFFLTCLCGNAQTRLVSTQAGGSEPLDGKAMEALILSPWQIQVKDSLAFFADQGYLNFQPFPGINVFCALREFNFKRKTIRTLVSNLPSISGLALSHTGDSLFFTSNGNILNLYRRSTGQRTILDTLPDSELDAVVCERSGRLLIGGGTGHRILLRELNGTYKVLAGKFGIAGSNNGLDTLARFNKISSLALSQTEDTVFISDRFNSQIRRLIRSTRQVSTLVLAGVFGPRQLAFNRRKDTLLCGNSAGHTIVRIAAKTGATQIFAGANLVPGYVDGFGATARFQFPMGITRSDSGWLVCDNANRRIRRISFSGQVSTFGGVGMIGDGIGLNTRMVAPFDLVKIPGKDSLIFSDQYNHTIRLLDMQNNRISTLAGNGISGNIAGIGPAARLSRPTNMAISTTGDSVYFVEPFSNKIKLLLLKTREVKWVAGSDTAGYVDKSNGRFARFNRPNDIALRGNFLYIADAQNHRIRVLNTQTTAVTTVAGSLQGFKDSNLVASRFNRPISLEFAGNYLFVGEDGGLRIRRISLDSGWVKVWAGSGNLGSQDGLGTQARFRGIQKLTYDTLSRLLFVAGFSNEGVLRAVETQIPFVSTYFDTTGFKDGYYPFCRFAGPTSMAFDPKRRRYLVTDANNNRIRAVQLYVNSAPTAKLDSVFQVFEDQPGPYTNFISQVKSGNSINDTLQTVQVKSITNLGIQSFSVNSGALTIGLKPDTNGDLQPVKLVLKDNGKTFFGGIDSTVYTFKLRVIPVNDPPVFSILGNDSAFAGQAKRTSGFILNSRPGPQDEANQTLSYTIGLSRPASFIQYPFIQGDTLFYTSHPDSLGLVQANIFALDNGGTSNGGQNSSDLKTFHIFLKEGVAVKGLSTSNPIFYPNPNKGILNFSQLPAETNAIFLYDISGGLKAEFAIQNKKEGSLNLQKFPSGLYFLKTNLADQKPITIILE